MDSLGMAASFASLSDGLLTPGSPAVVGPAARVPKDSSQSLLERVFGTEFGILDSVHRVSFNVGF